MVLRSKEAMKGAVLMLLGVVVCTTVLWAPHHATLVHGQDKHRQAFRESQRLALLALAHSEDESTAPDDAEPQHDTETATTTPRPVPIPKPTQGPRPKLNATSRALLADARAQVLNPPPGYGVNLAKHDRGGDGGAPRYGLSMPCAASCPHCEMAVDTTSVLSEGVLDYIRQNVLIAVVTGSFEKFFRMDLSFCTWLQHVPPEQLFVFTDNANASKGRPGTWVEGVLPAGVSFSKKQLGAKGYTIHWIRAQFRFIQGLQYIIEQDMRHEADHKWFVVIDDNTFVDLNAMVTFFKRHDKAKDADTPKYMGERGWGGAGHFFNRAASRVLHLRVHECVTKYMVRQFAASDVMLKKCMGMIGIEKVWDDHLSHCHANFLRERMLKGDHVTLHAKREMVEPRKLAMWRTRLYYQTLYHKNLTAYNLLLKVGACAYGSCKHDRCRKSHDDLSESIFALLSGDGATVPEW